MSVRGNISPRLRINNSISANSLAVKSIRCPARVTRRLRRSSSRSAIVIRLLSSFCCPIQYALVDIEKAKPEDFIYETRIVSRTYKVELNDELKDYMKVF